MIIPPSCGKNPSWRGMKVAELAARSLEFDQCGVVLDIVRFIRNFMPVIPSPGPRAAMHVELRAVPDIDLRIQTRNLVYSCHKELKRQEYGYMAVIKTKRVIMVITSNASNTNTQQHTSSGCLFCTIELARPSVFLFGRK